MRTSVYIDGFNLYYGSLKSTSYKWLDVGKLAQIILPQNQIVEIHYYTARVSKRDDDPTQPLRQQAYLRALSSIPNTKIVYGHFLNQKKRRKLADEPGFAKVILTEEKGSDANLASQFVHHAHQRRFDVGVLITNDSDLQEPVRIVRRELNLRVGVIHPISGHRKPSRELAKHATFTRHISAQQLKAAQFPETVPLGNAGVAIKPEAWK